MLKTILNSFKDKMYKMKKLTIFSHLAVLLDLAQSGCKDIRNIKLEFVTSNQIISQFFFGHVTELIPKYITQYLLILWAQVKFSISRLGRFC